MIFPSATPEWRQMALDEKLLAFIGEHGEGVLATIKRDGRPQLSNILYVWDAASHVARVSTTATRAKGRNLMRDPRATLYVPGGHFWAFAVADCDVEVIGPTTAPGDAAGQELLTVHSHFYGGLDEAAFFQEMVDNERLVAKLTVTHTYGLILDKPPGG
jgi:PPOX class probable F420-dependent enzyme